MLCQRHELNVRLEGEGARLQADGVLLADAVACEYLSNYPTPRRITLAPGLHGLSNGDLDEPWPKTLALKERLAAWVASGEDDVSPLWDALADETRARMSLLIATEGELCVCELTCALNESQPKTSRHLALLRSSGLLADRRQGQWVYYRLHPQLPAWARQLLENVAQANGDWLQADVARLQAMADRPLRQALCC